METENRRNGEVFPPFLRLPLSPLPFCFWRGLSLREEISNRVKRDSGFTGNKFWIFLLWGALASALSLGLYKIKPSFIQGIDEVAGDARFKARGKVAPSDDVIIVAIDEKSVNELGRWPWPRTTKERDKALGDAIKKAGNVILGYFLREEAGDKRDEKALSQIDRSKIKLVKMIGQVESVPLPELPGIEANIPVVGKDAAGFGLFNIYPDENDGKVRRSHLIFLHNEGVYPSLALEALRHYYKGSIILTLAPYGVDSIFINEGKLPTDESGRFRLNFYGKGGTFRTYTAVDVINGAISKDAIKDRIVFVGGTEKAIYDLRVTPLDPVFPGVEVHATVAANVLQSRFLTYDNRVIALDVFLMILLPISLCISITWVHRTFTSLLIFLAFLSFHTAANFYLFSSYNLVPSAVYPFISLVFAYLLSEAYRNIVVESKGRYLKKAFALMVSPELVSEILKDPDRLKLGVEKREITTLFSDIRGF